MNLSSIWYILQSLRNLYQMKIQNLKWTWKSITKSQNLFSLVIRKATLSKSIFKTKKISRFLTINREWKKYYKTMNLQILIDFRKYFLNRTLLPNQIKILIMELFNMLNNLQCNNNLEYLLKTLSIWETTWTLIRFKI